MSNDPVQSTLSTPLLGGEQSSPTYNTADASSQSGLRQSESSSLHFDDNITDDGASDIEFLEGLDEIPKTTVSQTFIHLIKGYIGPGCLSLPWAVSQVGYVGGTIAIAVMSFWSSYNCWTIVKIKRYIERVNNTHISVVHNEFNRMSKRNINPLEVSDAKSEVSSVASSALTYPDVGEWLYGERFQSFVSSCICVQQLAICTVFFSFIGENIYAVVQLVPDIVPSMFMSHIGVMTAALPFIMGLSFIPSLDALTPAMIAGTLLLFTGFGVLGYIIFAVWEDRPTEPVEVQWTSAPLALCAILYSYEGICLILPIESSMAQPRKFKKTFWSAMVCVAIILATVSNLCVYAFGEVTNGSVTAYLLEKYKGNKDVMMFLMIANTAVSLSVLFTYPLQLFPTIELLGPKATAFWWKWKHGGQIEVELEDDEKDLTGFDPMPALPEHDVASLSSYNDEHIYEKYERTGSPKEDDSDDGEEKKSETDLLRSSAVSNITDILPQLTIPGDSLTLRTILVLLTYMIAVIVPNVQALISLAGAVAGSSTALLIPPILEMALIDHLESTSDPTQSPRLRPGTSTEQKPSFTKRLLRHDLSGKFWKTKLKCYFLFWMGFVFFLIGAYASVADIVSIWIEK